MARQSQAAILALTLMLAPITGAGTEMSEALANLEKKRSELAPIVEPLMVRGAGLLVKVPYKPLVQAVDGLNSLPPTSRTVTLRSDRAPLARLWEDGRTWCHSYAEIQGNNDLNADALLSALSATPNPDGSVRLNAHADVGFKAQIHWHFMGRRVSGPFGIGNACPPGGGFGGSIGSSGKTGADLALAMKLSQSATAGALDYDISLLQPGSVNITLQFGFQNIGTLGIPTSIPLPLGSLAKGSLTLAFATDGSVELPRVGSRPYHIALTPISLVPDADGIRASWDVKISFE